MASAPGAAAPAPRSNVCFRLDQQAADFKAATGSSVMQQGVATEGKEKIRMTRTDGFGS
jgi:hypothetical protein